MLTYNTMRFGTDEFAFNKQSLLTARQPFNTTGNTSVDGFELSGIEPAGSQRKVLFQVDNTLWKFAGASLASVEGAADFANVMTNGNTIAELEEITDIPAWVDKQIYPIVGLNSPADALAMPTLKMGLKVRTSTDVYEKNVETAEYDLMGGDTVTPRIISIDPTIILQGRGAVNITARIKTETGWTLWQPYQNFKSADAQAIQFRIRYTVTEINGNDSAKCERIVVKHTQGTSIVAGDDAEIYSVMRDYGHGLQTCALAVRHKRLIDSQIKAYVNFMKPMSKRTFLPIGTSTGTAQNLILGENNVADTGIDPSTIQLFADGQLIPNFSYNTQTGEVTINIDAGKAVSANYNYGRQKETWHEMTVDVNQQPYDNATCLTRFIYSLDDEALDNQTVTNIRIELFRTSGTVTDEVLGNATGLTQQFVLAHAAKADTLNVNASFSYDENSQILTCVAQAGTQITASYDWLGERHKLYSWAASWIPAV